MHTIQTQGTHSAENVKQPPANTAVVSQTQANIHRLFRGIPLRLFVYKTRTEPHLEHFWRHPKRRPLDALHAGSGSGETLSHTHRQAHIHGSPACIQEGSDILFSCLPNAGVCFKVQPIITRSTPIENERITTDTRGSKPLRNMLSRTGRSKQVVSKESHPRTPRAQKRGGLFFVAKTD